MADEPKAAEIQLSSVFGQECACGILRIPTKPPGYTELYPRTVLI
jgi:hypothetical protein